MARLSNLLIVLLLAGCSQEKVQVIEGSIYGTTYSIQFTEDIDKLKINELIEAELRRIDMVFSTYKEKSLVSAINNSKCVELAVGIMTDSYLNFQEKEEWNNCASDEFKYLLNLSKAIKTDSNNAFNPVALSENVNFYCPKSICLDFSAIGKGYAVDKISELLVMHGITNYFIEIGGEISINGTKYDDSWSWGINNPFVLSLEAYRAFKAPKEGISIATSGEYRNPGHIWGDGRKDIASVTVIADNTTKADAWATAMYVLGIEQGLKVANRNGLAVFFIKEDGKTVESLTWSVKTFSSEQLLEEIKEQIL